MPMPDEDRDYLDKDFTVYAHVRENGVPVENSVTCYGDIEEFLGDFLVYTHCKNFRLVEVIEAKEENIFIIEYDIGKD